MAKRDRAPRGRSGVSEAVGTPTPSSLAWLRALRDPELATTWTLAEWERVVRLARRMRLLARLAVSLESAGLSDRVPAQPRRHLLAEQRLSRWRTSAVLWSMEQVAEALGDAAYPRVLLKGAAYVAQGLSFGAGRIPSDLDVLVPKAHLADAQARLTAAGWTAQALDEHDRRYYDEWSHEVPPMRHPLLTVELDLHHNVLPPVARTTVDADKLLAKLRSSNCAGWKVLAPVDQLLHSAAHLFFDSQLVDRMRDLADMDALFRHFGPDPSFISGLVLRAAELGLEEPLALACHFCTRWFATPIPADVRSTIASMGPGPLHRAWLVPLLNQVLLPAEPDATWRPKQQAAATMLLARYHLRRMPLRLLVPHVWHRLGGHRTAQIEASERAGL